nr:MAG TPA: hypothetical protein [Caudoviricetes sp.]
MSHHVVAVKLNLLSREILLMGYHVTQSIIFGVI